MTFRRNPQPSVRRPGFTLLEVLIVIGLLAILAAFVVPDLMGTREAAKEDIARTLISANGPVARALDLYLLHMNTYPDELADLSEPPDDDEDREKWRGPYITNPQDLEDPWGQALEYRFPGEHNPAGYDLHSLGIDGQDDTDDDIANYDFTDIVTNR